MTSCSAHGVVALSYNELEAISCHWRHDCDDRHDKREHYREHGLKTKK